MVRLIISEPSLLLKAKLNEYTFEVIDEKDEFNYCVFDFLHLQAPPSHNHRFLL
jgi:hypothetical protein